MLFFKFILLFYFLNLPSYLLFLIWFLLFQFQSTPGNTDVTLIDFNTIFVSDVIQEALYRDAYAVAQPLEPADNLFEEDEIRDHIYGLKLLKYKAPALMWMMNLILGSEDRDFIKSAAQILVNSRWVSDTAGLVDDMLIMFLEI